MHRDGRGLGGVGTEGRQVAPFCRSGDLSHVVWLMMDQPESQVAGLGKVGIKVFFQKIKVLNKVESTVFIKPVDQAVANIFQKCYCSCVSEWSYMLCNIWTNI